MQIHISDDLSNRIKRFVDSGVFASIEEATESAIKDRIILEEWIAENRAYISKAIDEGIKSIEEGKFITFEDLKKELLK